MPLMLADWMADYNPGAFDVGINCHLKERQRGEITEMCEVDGFDFLENLVRSSHPSFFRAPTAILQLVWRRL